MYCGNNTLFFVIGAKGSFDGNSFVSYSAPDVDDEAALEEETNNNENNVPKEDNGDSNTVDAPDNAPSDGSDLD